MNVHKTKEAQTAPTTAESTIIDEIYRRLVQIHNAIAIRTTDDKIVMPWTENELMTLIEEVEAFRRKRRDPATQAASSTTPASVR